MKSLTSYKRIRVDAGYRGMSGGQSVTTAFEGSIQFSFQELPGPDSVVCFQFLLGDLTTWTGALYAGTLEGGTSLF